MYIADLHIHSKYSRATSRDCDLPHLDAGMRLKGVQLLGAGDFTHPAWRGELRSSLEPAEEGLYRLRKELRLSSARNDVPDPRFVVSGEISTIYKKDGKTRKVHHLILLPSIDAADELSRRLELIGNIHSDGRPILGLDSRDLAEITFDSCPEAIFIPAHIWTPHFSLFGAFSEFSAIEECYGDMTRHIYALETGLSSDPPMNRQLSALDKYRLVSNSDAHSPAKLAREANILTADMSYPALRCALETGEGLSGTIEFFPEEGKYHLDGHRACKCRLEPAETRALNGRCPVCGKKLTIGVQNRVDQLSDRAAAPAGACSFEYLMPLEELLADCMGASPASKKVQAAYSAALNALGPELYILRQAPVADITAACGELVAEAMRRLRAGDVIREAGYDGEYGRISLFHPGERETLRGQLSFIDLAAPVKTKRTRQAAAETPAASQVAAASPSDNPEQAEAICAGDAAIAVVAGPGTGKTHTLVERVAHMISAMGIKPTEITAVTFTNQAAAELKERLEKKLGRRAIKGLTVGTFHSVCLGLIPKAPIAGHAQAMGIISEILARRGDSLSPTECLRRISALRNGADAGPLPEGVQDEYSAALRARGLRDLDDILEEALDVDISAMPMFKNLLVDEYQDVNALQRRLVARWTGAGGSLFVIGDPDQSIYGFRGASAECFTGLRALLPHMRTITLMRNYRSTPQVLSAALKVISQNPGGKRSIVPARGSGMPVRVIAAPDTLSEGHMIAREISRMTGGVDMVSASGMEPARAFSDVAVICRTRHQLSRIESCLAQEGIPCAVIGRDDSLADEETQGALAFFRTLMDPGDRQALDRAAQLLGNAQASSAADRLAPRIAKEKPVKLLSELSAITGREYAQLKDAALFYPTMPALIDALETGEEIDVKRISGSYASGAVSLMTMHGAKGLEFPAVFLAGVTDGIFPSALSANPSEERRLFFVGITRARDELIISCAGKPSPLMDALPEDIVRETARQKRPKPVYEQLTFL